MPVVALGWQIYNDYTALMAVLLAPLCGVRTLSPFAVTVSVLNALKRHLIHILAIPKSSPFISDKVQSGQPYPRCGNHRDGRERGQTGSP
jgi:hypothetical protein